MPIRPATIPIPGAIRYGNIGDWLGLARPGDSPTYHLGFLAIDTDPAASPLCPDARLALSRLAGEAWSPAAAGRLHLVQKRAVRGGFFYIAIAARRGPG